MKILLLNQFFWPDASATSQLLTDLARGLVADQHEVTVICSEKGYFCSTDKGAVPTVRVIHVRSLKFARGRLGRVLSYLSFYVLAAWRSFTLPRQDVVLTLTTPPLLPLLGTLLKRARGTAHVIWEMDVYPDVAVALGYFKAGGAIERVVGALADFSRRNANCIIALADCMRSLLIARNIPSEQIRVVHNWSDTAAITPQPLPGRTGQLSLLYSGNLGLAHDVTTLKDSMRSLRDEPGVHFTFAGGGAHTQELRRFVNEQLLSHVSFRSHVDREDLGTSLSSGDIGLVTQRDVCCGAVVPSKVYGLLAAGRPYIFIGPAAAAPARILETFSCGWYVRPGDDRHLTEILLHLKTHREEIEISASSARRAAVERFDLPQGVERIITILKASREPRPVNMQASEIATANYEEVR